MQKQKCLKTLVSLLKKKELSYNTKTPTDGKNPMRKRAKKNGKIFNLSDMTPPSFSLHLTEPNIVIDSFLRFSWNQREHHHHQKTRGRPK